jgi:hypothetical protein
MTFAKKGIGFGPLLAYLSTALWKSLVSVHPSEGNRENS